MKRLEFKVPSSDNIHTLSGVVYLPEGDAKGLFHIVHGMTEHIGRYDRIMSDMAAEGYICFGYDNLGHGLTARDDSELGYIAKAGGYDFLARDVKVFSDAVKAEYDHQSRLPYFLMGHSMGSFITRLAVTKYVAPDKFVIMGTGGKNPAAGLGLLIIAVIKGIFGDKYISELVYKLALGSYNKPFGGGTKADPSPWITRDKNVRDKYYADKFCSFKFTVSAMGDLVRLNKITNQGSWYKNMPKDLPVLLVSGEMDPVGGLGKGVLQVEKGLKRAKINARSILYSNARHEILNDSTFDEVKKDILEFIKE